MAETIVGPLVSKLQELALSEGRALVAVSGEIGNLRDKLMWLLAFLQEADPRRRARASELMRVLVHQTRDAAFSAEDAVDEYVYRVDLSRYPSWSRAALGFLAAATTQLLVRHRLSGQIAAINARLEEIVGNKDKYRLEDSAAVPSAGTWTASAASSSVALTWDVSKPQIIGRQKEQSELEEKLLNSDARLAVIYVVGESGVGRTMLVNSVYQKSTIRDHFKFSAVVKVHRNAGISNIFRSICDSLNKTQTVEEQEDHIEQPGRNMLQSRLAGQCYLVVIDGRQMAIADWNAVIHALPKEETGSRVVLITKKKPRFLNHLNHCREDIIKLQGLQYKDCKELFHRRLHGSEEAEGNCYYTRRYYRRVHNITGGLPLAVILLSGLMHNKEFPGEWDNVFKYLESAKSKRLDKILSLSFEDLHHELKLCFLYFTAFPEINGKAYRSTLVKLWVAEGFLAPRDGKTAEDLGHTYLRQLIARGLVDETAIGDGSFHPLALHGRSVYSFARSEAREASFMEIHEGDHVPEPATVRRLTLQNSMDRYAALDNTMPKLRSIIAIFGEERAATDTVNPTPEDLSSTGTGCFPSCCFPALCSSKQNSRSLTKLLQGSKFLRVIMLEGMDIGTELPEEIGSMVHLRYLGARCQSLKTIHASIGKLSNLQTMDVTNSSVSELPLSFWKIASLRHVSGHRLVMPRRAGELKRLNTLSSVRTSEDWDGEILTRMANLKILDVIIEGKLKATAFSNNLSKLSYLTTLNLELTTLNLEGEGYGLPVSIFMGPSLQWLKTMRLTGTLLHLHMASLPGFQLPNLNDLSLSKTQLHKMFIERLGELPCLAKLTLLGVSYEGEKLVFQHDGFHCLRKLAVRDTAISVLIEELALPALEKLQLIGCSRQLQHKIHPSHKYVKMIKQEDRNLFQDINSDKNLFQDITTAN